MTQELIKKLTCAHLDIAQLTDDVRILKRIQSLISDLENSKEENQKIPFAWEEISRSDAIGWGSVITRSKVIGGWIVNNYTLIFTSNSCSESMVFVPDKHHEWEI